MPAVNYTKNELKLQKDNLQRYNRYLPTLYIKKQQLQKETLRVKAEMDSTQSLIDSTLVEAAPWIGLLARAETVFKLDELITLSGVSLTWENIAGVSVPLFSGVNLYVKDYDLFNSPLWIDHAVELIGKVLSLKAQRSVLVEQMRILNEELRITTQRVNLFERIKIPQTVELIKRISICLGDRQTAAVCLARYAKQQRAYDS